MSPFQGFRSNIPFDPQGSRPGLLYAAPLGLSFKHWPMITRDVPWAVVSRPRVKPTPGSVPKKEEKDLANRDNIFGV